MPEHVSILQLVGVAALALATVIWVVGLVRLLRRDRFEVAVCRHGDRLRAIPHQRQSGPVAESVELTPEEHAAFAGLVRQFSDSRP
ncbi:MULTISPECIES: hypothetical protein [unclassified Streptomyces]|uniref:hypothetical protein n=1 Tax=unclassified Streptomyces TaxID=2593676 RepID=UPI002E806565|nr:hypothetical protein [Streptomyces sp. NBC_00589]WTI38576.1 hypothetical protein OIC96_28090 [Streptomyces sp. NBC_00775]WUB27745.1 hypothetical protein OHA51_21645 [Streptomyces sp. NBC_00589]